MFDFKGMREQIRKVTRARYNLDKARAKAARNAALSGYSSNGDRNIRTTAEAAYDTAQRDLDIMRGNLLPLINAMPDNDRKRALYLRYIEGKSVREIAIRMMYAENYMYRFIELAENEINDKLVSKVKT